MNKITLIGRLTHDLEVKYTQGREQKAMARFSLAVPRKYKQDGKPDTDFFPCVAFGRAAETLEKWAGKGKRVFVEGRLEINDYQNANGEIIKYSSVLVDNFEIIDFKEKEIAQKSGDSFGDFSFSQSDDGRIPF